MHKTHIRQIITRTVTVAVVLVGLAFVATSQPAFADCTSKADSGNGVTTTTCPTGSHYCGDPNKTPVTTSIDLGCKGKGNPIMDMLFAFIRFLSYGVGLVIIASLTYAGIQYTGSRGDPNANAMAVKRIQANVSALLIFVFAFAIVNYVLPGQVLK